ncbi:MAG TPA: PaaI family thioesterase [Syntrophomonadaceae bacterium]|nr:PaaI family thioesterase [Syntrophomonadaceae bacterium]
MFETFNEILKGTYQELNGIRITHVEKGEAIGVIDIESHHLNPNGTLHGAVLVTLADSVAMTGVVYSYDIAPAATTSLSISFIKTVKTGQVRAEAKMLSQGRNVSAWQVDCYDEKNNLLATVQSNFSMLKKGSTEWEEKM